MAASGVTIATAAGAAAPAPLASLHRYTGVALSPDGTQVADIESGGDSQAPHGVVVRNAANGKVVAIFDPCDACAYSDPAWSPDGKSLAFVGWDASARTGFLWTAQGQALHPTATFDGLLAKPRYSPNSKTLAVLATEHPSKEAGATSAAAPLEGDLDTPPDERRIAVIEATSPKLRFVSPDDRYVFEYDWTPDGQGFVVTDAIGDEPDNEWFVAKLEAVDLATGATRLIAAPKTQVRNPRVSPDGKSVAYIGGLMDDYGEVPTGGDIWAAPFGGGEPRNLTPGFKGTFNSLQRVAGKLYATAVVFDRFTLYAIEKDGGLKSMWSDLATVQAGDGRISLSADASRMATMMQGFTISNRIVAGPVAKPTAITHENDGLVANADARSISYTNDGLIIQGWLLAPKNLQPGKTYPLATYVHGGPAHFQESRFQWDNDVYALLDHGYFVFQPNYRGSFGQGLAFQNATIMDFGGGDLRDILAGVDAVEKIAPIDDNRLAIFGHSYGGYMTSWAVTQTDRFKAAVVSAGISDWVIDYGLIGIPKSQDAYFRGITPYERPDLFDRISPLRFVKQVKTPTFLYGGDADAEAAIAEAVAFWRGLKAMGVPTSLVVYPGEGHKLSSRVHEEDTAARTVAWFDKYVGGGAR